MGVARAQTVWPLAAASLRKRHGRVLFIGGAVLALFWLSRNSGVLAEAKVHQAFLAGSIAALATALGTLPVLVARKISARVRDALLGFAAGVMLAATAFSLVIPALEAAVSAGAGKWAAGFTVAAALLLGGALLVTLDHWVPSGELGRHPEGSAISATAIRRAWLFVFAVSLHNLPEGLAIGVGYAGSSHNAANALATGIAIQDLPEGLVIALALLTAGYRRVFSVVVGALSGLIEPVAAALGAAVIGLSAGLLPWGLAFAAGAMLYVISHDIIPESHQQGQGRLATMALLLGFVLMMVLDTALK